MSQLLKAQSERHRVQPASAWQASVAPTLLGFGRTQARSTSPPSLFSSRTVGQADPVGDFGFLCGVVVVPGTSGNRCNSSSSNSSDCGASRSSCGSSAVSAAPCTVVRGTGSALPLNGSAVARHLFRYRTSFRQTGLSVSKLVRCYRSLTRAPSSPISGAIPSWNAL